MALIKYIGVENIVVNLNGQRKLIKPNKIFSGPTSFKDFPNFQIIGYDKKEKESLEKNSTDLTSKGVKLEIRDYFTPFVDIDYLDEIGLPKVSICIVTKNGYDNIKRCLDSIVEYVKYINFEVLLCDTGTTDEKVIKFYEECTENIPDKFKVFMGHEYNFSKNNNFLVKESTGDVVLFMNNDVFLTYDAITKMVGYILCSNIGCLGHRLVFDRDKNIIQHDGQILYQTNGQWYGPGHHNLNKNIKDLSTENKKVEGVTAAFLMLRKSIFNKVNGFDEEYVDIFQDVDLNLKVSKLGYDNFCIRDNSLIHVDHGTRKDDIKQESFRDFEKFKKDWVSKGPYPTTTKKHFSILVCATNKTQLKTLLNSIKTREPYEFIFLNNRSNYFWSSEALNCLTRVSEGELLIWMHQDVTFDAYDPFTTIEDLIVKLGGKFGILGPAGLQVGETGDYKGVDFSSLKYTFDFLKCQTLDEFCLIGKRSNNLSFGEYLDDFHFYGADICMQAIEKGLSVYVVKIPITHHSGGSVNLLKPGGYESYLKQGRKFYKKWCEKYPNISTTTVHFRKQFTFWYLGGLLGLNPSKEFIDIKNIDETPTQKAYLMKKEFNVEKFFGNKENGVSIIILNKDKPEYIKKCINAIIKYTKDIKYEILIGDTGTTDKKTKAFYTDVMEICDSIKIIEAGDYQFSKNNNLVIKEAKYNRTLFLNNDVFINSNLIKSMYDLIYKNTAIVGAKLLYVDGLIQHVGIEMKIEGENNPNEYYLPIHVHYKDTDIKIETKEVDCVTGACLMIPTMLYNECGGFDEKYERVFQDIDLCLMVREMGYKIMCCNDEWATHIESGSRDSSISEADYHLMTGRWGKKTYK